MNYDQFRFEWYQALNEAGLLAVAFPPSETLDLGSMNRAHHLTLAPSSKEPTGPFFVTVGLGWMWDALQSARSTTTEEDILAELLGEDSDHTDTQPPWVRIDVALKASLAEDSLVPVPPSAVWRRWSAEVIERLAPLFPVGNFEDGEEPPSFSWREEPRFHVRCAADGHLYLVGVEMCAWQGIGVPRDWDNPDRQPDEEPADELADLMERVCDALPVWEDCLRHLCQ